MKNRKPITKRRHRYAKALEQAVEQNLLCYIWLHIAGSMSDDEIVDALSEDFMKASKRITLPTVEIPGITCIRSEKHGRILPKDAVIADGELGDIPLSPITYTEDPSSPVWHFAGGIWLVNNETCFCEYDTHTRKGGMMIFIDGKNIPQVIAKYPQLRIEIDTHNQYSQLQCNW